MLNKGTFKEYFYVNIFSCTSPHLSINILTADYHTAISSVDTKAFATENLKVKVFVKKFLLHLFTTEAQLEHSIFGKDVGGAGYFASYVACIVYDWN